MGQLVSNFNIPEDLEEEPKPEIVTELRNETKHLTSYELRKRILAHRGLWQEEAEANSVNALRTALSEGFGIETDLRDVNQELVISHDPAGVNVIDYSVLHDIIRNIPTSDRGWIALNIKSDGLAPFLASRLEREPIENVFMFDMSVPQLIKYLQLEMPVAMRLSEYETEIAALMQMANSELRFWVDGFESEWWIGENADRNLPIEAQIVVVSPEIHGRDPINCWKWFIEEVRRGRDVYLCTDFPHRVEIMFEHG